MTRRAYVEALSRWRSEAAEAREAEAREIYGREQARLASGGCRLASLSDDEVRVVAHELCDPLRPSLAVHLSSTAKGLRAAMQPTLAELQQQRLAAEALAALWDKGLAWLRAEDELWFGKEVSASLTLGHWGTLGNLVACRSLSRLVQLHICGADNAVEGTALLAEGFRRGGLPSLEVLNFDDAMVGPVNLATCLTTSKLPALKTLHLEECRTSMGDEGLGALAPALRKLSRLQHLYLADNLIGDRGMALLLAEPMEGVLPILSFLRLSDNMLTNACLPHLELILCGGALPAITKIDLRHNNIAAQFPKHLYLAGTEPRLRISASNISASLTRVIFYF